MTFIALTQSLWGDLNRDVTKCTFQHRVEWFLAFILLFIQSVLMHEWCEKRQMEMIEIRNGIPALIRKPIAST